MGLAVAVHIASEFTGRVQFSVFPFLLDRLINTRHEPSANLPELSRLIRMDPALCFMAMRLDRTMGSTPQASSPPGMDTVVDRIGMAGIDAITTQALADQALNEVHHRQGLALGWLWRHCLTTALLAQRIARELNFHPVEDAYIAGLLHDIGKIAMFARTPAACTPMLADPTQAAPLLEAETQVAGSDHGRIGAQLISRHTGAWFAADAARYHNAATAKIVNALPLVQIVWVANRLAREPLPSSDAHQEIAALLNLDPLQLSHLTRAVGEQVLEVASELRAVPDVPVKTRNDDAHQVPLSQEIKDRAALSRVYGELLTATNRSAIIRVLQQSLIVFLGIDTVIMVDHEPQSGILIGRFATGNVCPRPINQLRIPLTASDCLPVTCLVGGKPVDSFSRAGRGELTILDQQLMDYMQKDGIICIPVQSDIGDGRACLLVGIDDNAWPWVKRQTNLLTDITEAVAKALEREQRVNDQRNSQAADRETSTLANTRKIVHEINNPLTIIKNYLKVLTRRKDKNLSGMDELRIINEEINRVTGLIKSLTSPSEKIPYHFESVDVNAAITDVLGLFRQSLTDGTAIRLDQDLEPCIPGIVSDRDRLKQALINLVKNAMEAMPDGGTIRVSTRMLKVPSRHLGSNVQAGHIKISVCDNGPGIDDGIEDKLFKPNVTSKAGHDGLGLSIVHEAVTHLKGSLFYESTPGQGTCFHIELPAGNNGSEN